MRMLPMAPPAWRLRAFLTVCLVTVTVFATEIYQAVQGPLESELAAKQMENDATSYAIGSGIARADIIGYAWLASVLLLLLLWIPYVVGLLRYLSAPKAEELAPRQIEDGSRE